MAATLALPVTSLYVGLLILLLAFLSLRVGLLRKSSKVLYADGGNKELLHRARAQGNLAEYLPPFALLLLLAEARGTPPALLHGFGLAFLACRLAHAYQVSQPSRNVYFRMYGFLGSIALLAAGAAHAVLHSLAGTKLA